MNRDNNSTYITSSATDHCTADDRLPILPPVSSADPSLLSLLSRTHAESQSPRLVSDDSSDSSDEINRQELYDILSSALDVIGDSSTLFNEECIYDDPFECLKMTSSSIASKKHSSPRQ